MKESFFDASIRHWYDACILESAGEYDNAVCLHGFAAECALKTIFQQCISQDLVTRYGHKTDLLLQDILALDANGMETASILNPSLGLRLSGIQLESILFADHPQRRYFEDEYFNREDAVTCRENALKYLKEMIKLYMDGYIENV